MCIHGQNTGSRPRFTAICSQTVRPWLGKNDLGLQSVHRFQDQSDETCEISKFGIHHVVWYILFTCLPKLSILYMLAICLTFPAGEADHCTSEGICVYIYIYTSHCISILWLYILHHPIFITPFYVIMIYHMIIYDNRFQHYYCVICNVQQIFSIWF